MEQLAPRRNLRDELRDRGVRMTHQRELVLELIQGSSRHLDAESLWKLAARKDPHINLATIYRTLTLLKRFGLVDELDLMHIEGEKHYYEVARLRSHIHLACFHCGEIQEFQTPLFTKLCKQVEQECSFSIKTSRLEFGGLCTRCRQKEQPAADSLSQ
jgi:Fur family ferric uptake transcriptional regulator